MTREKKFVDPPAHQTGAGLKHLVSIRLIEQLTKPGAAGLLLVVQGIEEVPEGDFGVHALRLLEQCTRLRSRATFGARRLSRNSFVDGPLSSLFTSSCSELIVISDIDNLLAGTKKATFYFIVECVPVSGDWHSFEPLMVAYAEAALSPTAENIVAMRVVRLSA